jgi:hypothetical protein
MYYNCYIESFDRLILNRNKTHTHIYIIIQILLFKRFYLIKTLQIKDMDPIKLNVGVTRNHKSGTGVSYSVSLSVMHETIVGENLCVLGSIPELGMWKEFKCKMVWTEGHVWRTVNPLITSEPAFRYKYALLDGENEES